MIDSLANSSNTLLVHLLVVGAAPGCSILFHVEPDRDAAAGAELDASVDVPLDSGIDAQTDAAIDAQTDAAIDAGCDPADCTQGLPTCLALLEQCPCALSGSYSLDPDGEGKGAPFEAYCDMVVAGGGWTLVGRSVPGRQAGPFGWGVDRGTIDEVGEPYSLDVLTRALPMTELLVGGHLDGMTWDANVFEISVPAGFPSDYGASAADTSAGVTVIEGECRPARFTQDWMLKSVGFTSETDQFFFRDLAELQPSGLNQGAWNLAKPTCDRSGLLHGLPGMIFVR